MRLAFLRTEIDFTERASANFSQHLVLAAHDYVHYGRNFELGIGGKKFLSCRDEKRMILGGQKHTKSNLSVCMYV